MELRQSVSRSLRRLWDASGKSQGDIVDEAGVTRAAFGAWLRGSRLPTLHNLQKVAAVCDATVLVGFSGPDEERAVVPSSLGLLVTRVEDLDPKARARVHRFAALIGAMDENALRVWDAMMDQAEAQAAAARG